MNRSVRVSQSITLSWKINYTAQENSQDRIVLFKRYPQNNSSAVVLVGSVMILALVSSATSYRSHLAPRITVVRSAFAISEPAITIQNATEQDEGFYQIEVEVGTAPVASHTILLTVSGNYVHLT